MNKYAKVIVLHNPKSDILKKINTYIDIVGTLYVVDNTEDKAFVKKTSSDE